MNLLFKQLATADVFNKLPSPTLYSKVKLPGVMYDLLAEIMTGLVYSDTVHGN